MDLALRVLITRLMIRCTLEGTYVVSYRHAHTRRIVEREFINYDAAADFLRMISRY